jgi:hypothetical protein
VLSYFFRHTKNVTFKNLDIFITSLAVTQTPLSYLFRNVSYVEKPFRYKPSSYSTAFFLLSPSPCWPYSTPGTSNPSSSHYHAPRSTAPSPIVYVIHL